jgi:hypothetical protein
MGDAMHYCEHLKRISLLFLAIVIITWAVSPQVYAYEAATAEDGPIAKSYFKRQITTLLYQNNFVELEKTANNLISSEAKFADGTWKLTHFFSAFSEPRNQSPDGWKRYLAMLDEWLAQYPHSITARTAAATGWIGFAWNGRGGDFAYQVTEEGWRLFAERLKKAATFVSVKPKTLSADSPERHLVLLTLANYQGMDRPHYEHVFHEAVSSFPRYQFYYYVAKAHYLLPMWHGDAAQLKRFMMETANQLDGSGKMIYTAIVINNWGDRNEFKTFEDGRISWEIMKEGFDEMRRQAPSSPFVLNYYCLFASLAGDKETAKRLFKEIGDRPYLDCWHMFRRPDEFFKWRKWAFGTEGGQAKQEHFRDGTEDFRQMLLIALKGDAEAQFRAGVMLSEGVVVQSDPGEGLKWLTLAAKQGHIAAQTALGFYEKDVAKAATWNYIAAIQGSGAAASRIGQLYDIGYYVKQDLVKAYAWYSQSQPSQGEGVTAKLTSAQLAEAKAEALKLKELIKLRAESVEVQPVDPDTLQVPDLRITIPPDLSLKLPTGNLLKDITWEASGGGRIDGNSLFISDEGSLTARVSVTNPPSTPCVLVSTTFKHSRPKDVVAGTPVLFADAMLGDREASRIYLGLMVGRPPHKDGPWYQYKEIPGVRFDGIRTRFATAGKQEGSRTELRGTSIRIFKTCAEAKKEGESLFAQ